MKIAIISPLFPPRWLAGAEIASYYIAKNLADKGNEVHIITSWDCGLEETSRENDFFIHRIRCKKIQYISSFIFLVKSVKLILRLNPDIVHSQGIYTGMTGIIIKYFIDKPCVIWAQGSDVYYGTSFVRFFVRVILSQTSQLIALTKDMNNEIKKLSRKDSIILPNGIDLTRFMEKNSNVCVKYRESKSNHLVLLFVGTLRPVKGVYYLIQAIYILISKGYGNIDLLLVGDGGDRQYLESLTKELHLEKNVNFIGQVPNDKIPYYMMCSDIFILPSISEGFPLVILEAMASGLPIIATKVRGLSEIVIDRENGLLVDSGSANDIADKILELMHDDKLREKIAKNNLEKSHSYSWDIITDRLYNIYLNNILK